jgi:hypothetical protein
MSAKNRPVIIYISAASDLMAEREALARMIAALPVTLAWRVVQTPLSEAEVLNPEDLQAADVHVLLMGSDIRAPVGLEWHLIRRAGRPSVAFLKRGITRTPAGQVFIKEAGVSWRPFSDAADLSRQIQHVVAEHLLRDALRYALTPVELEQLENLLAAEASPEDSSQGQEAGHSAIILSRERYEPGEGIIVDKP